MRENRLYGSEGGGTLNQSSLPLSMTVLLIPVYTRSRASCR